MTFSSRYLGCHTGMRGKPEGPRQSQKPTKVLEETELPAKQHKAHLPGHFFPDGLIWKFSSPIRKAVKSWWRLYWVTSSVQAVCCAVWNGSQNYNSEEQGDCFCSQWRMLDRNTSIPSCSVSFRTWISLVCFLDSNFLISSFICKNAVKWLT